MGKSLLSLTVIPKYSELPISLQKLELFLFDMDGTLLNTEFIHAQSIEVLLEGKMDAKVIMERFKGMSDKAVFEVLSRELQIKIDPFQVIDRKNQELIKIIRQLTKEEISTIFPAGMEQFINDLKQAKKKIALVTASESVVAYELLDKLDIKPKLDLVVTYQTTHQSKPNPSPYLYALRHFHRQATESVILEDSNTGLEAANLAGTHLIKALWYHA